MADINGTGTLTDGGEIIHALNRNLLIRVPSSNRF